MSATLPPPGQKEQIKVAAAYALAAAFFGTCTVFAAATGGDWPIPLIICAWALMELFLVML